MQLKSRDDNQLRITIRESFHGLKWAYGTFIQEIMTPEVLLKSFIVNESIRKKVGGDDKFIIE